jgi:hypothetical protein
VTALEHCITTRGEAHRKEYCIHEISKLKREEEKEAAKGVAYSKICRAWVIAGLPQPMLVPIRSDNTAATAWAPSELD